MKSLRIKRTGPVIKTRAQMEEIVGQIRTLKIQERLQVLQRDQKIKAIDELYGPLLSEGAKAMEEKVALVQAWAESNPEEFGAKKSIETPHGVIGFRTGTPKLAKLARFTWAKVFDALKASTIGKLYIRTKEEIDKEAILGAHSTGKVTTADLRNLGCEVVQEESFFVDPNLTEVETREVASA
jgi:phage host-nuclease inhibitor protein Gam